MRLTTFKFLGFYILAVLFLPYATAAQSAGNENTLTILARSDGSAYIIHNYSIPLSHGFRVYRRVEGEEGWQELTKEPFFPVQNGYQLKQAMGPEFEFIQDEMDRENPQRIFLTLQSQTNRNTIIHAAIPDLAIQLGRAYLDEDAPIGSRVSYRIEIVNDLEKPTGKVLEGSTLLIPRNLLPPTNITVENTDRRVMVDWQYPTKEEAPETENIIRFKTFYQDMDTGKTVDATDAIFVRTLGDTEYRKYITVPQRNREYEFWVEAVDISGQSTASETIRLKIKDNVPPPIIRNVEASVTEDYESEIVWPVSTELELAGYHVYMARGDEEEYTRLTDELLPPLQTSYLHTDAEPGVQYRYAVTAVDENGNEGELSNPAHVYIWDYTIPKPITGLDARYDSELKTVNLEWLPGEDYRSLKTYQILRRQIHPSAGDQYSQLNDEAHLEESLVDYGPGTDGFREGVSFEYGIIAVSKNGNRSDTVWTQIQIPDLTPPEPPSSIQTQMRNGEKIQVAWNASVSDDVTSYKLYRLDAEADSTLFLKKNEKGNRYFLDRDVQLDHSYVYSVAAIDSVGNESEPLLSDMLIAHKTHPPVPSKNIQALYTDGHVILQWQMIDTSQVTGYRIYRSDIPTGMYDLIGETSADTLRFTDNGSTAGQWFKVFPVDKIGREARTARPVQAVTNE